MNTRTRTIAHTMKSPLILDQNEKQRRRSVDSGKSTANRGCSRRERKLALLQDVDKLKKKLSQEESVHRALERAFTRPLGSLPRLPSYLPPHTLALLAEVAVLEEEVVRLEEQVVNFRQGLYDEAFNVSSSKRIKENPINSSHTSTSQSVHDNSPTLPIGTPQLAPSPSRSRNRSTRLSNERRPSRRALSFDDTRNKENHSCINITKNNKQSQKQLGQRIKSMEKESATAQSFTEKELEPLEMKIDCKLVEQDSARDSSSVIPEEMASKGEGSGPNKISEDILKCMSSILLRMRTQKNRNSQSNTFSSFIKLPSQENSEDFTSQDPYGICSEYGQRDIGPYKNLHVIDANSMDINRKTNSLFLLQRLKILLGKLASVDIQGLTHLEKLAFWINVYNSCMMNAFLEHGIPDSPQKIIMLLQKAIVNVGGESLNAMTIEHFILRLPHHLKSTGTIPGEHEVKRKQAHFGLEWSEHLVTFALSCGSWSSPAVRVYTPSQVENELEVAKKDYLKAAVGISASNKLVIPKLLDWYLLDFAKDLESLLDWICLQLPSDLRKDALRCLESESTEPLSLSVQVLPYEFGFRYLIHD